MFIWPVTACNTNVLNCRRDYSNLKTAISFNYSITHVFKFNIHTTVIFWMDLKDKQINLSFVHETTSVVTATSKKYLCVVIKCEQNGFLKEETQTTASCLSIMFFFSLLFCGHRRILALSKGILLLKWKQVIRCRPKVTHIHFLIARLHIQTPIGVISSLDNESN